MTSVAGSLESWNSGVQNTGFTFETAGTYDYYCVIHGVDNWGDRSSNTLGHIHGRGNGRYAELSQHRYVKPGTYTVTVQIRDGIGRKVMTESTVLVYK